MERSFALFGKIALGILLAGILLGGGIYLGKKGITNLPNNPTPTIAPSVEPTNSLSQSATIAPSVTKSVNGKIEGSLGYPAEMIPPLEVFAIDTNDKSKHLSVKTGANVNTFIIDNVEPGTYYVVAYPQSGGTLAGGYTKAVACGLSVNCKDHDLIEVTIKEGETIDKIEVKDWYAPEGTFPPKP